MKKLLFLLIGMMLFLTACGSGDNEIEAISDTGGGEAASREAENTTLSDTTVETDEYKIVIKDSEIIQADYKDSEYLTLDIEFTNKRSEPTTPWYGFARTINAYQETDTTIEELEELLAPMYPEDYKAELIDTASSEIKEGSTVDAVVGYELIYPKQHVRLIDGDDEPETFEKIVETK